jgi:hypothetical protein
MAYQDIRGNPWKFDATGQGQGLANASSWLYVGDLTVTNASNLFTTGINHGLSTGTEVRLDGTTAPTGTSKGVTYYVIRQSATTFKLATTAANARAGTNLSISSDGTAVDLDMKPTFKGKIYVKDIVVSGDGTNEGTVEITNASGGYTIVRTEVADKDTGQSTAIVPVHDFVDGLYVTTLDASNAVVLVYHGRV